jgi:hypothetical protein
MSLRTVISLALLAALYLALAWPGAGERGIIAEEITPYLGRHPVVLAGARDDRVTLLPPHDRPDPQGWVSTAQWPNLSFYTDHRSWPVLIKGHQSALGTYPGIAAAPLLGDGIAGVRRSSVLLGLGLLVLAFALARRLGLRPPFAAAAALACTLSPGLLFFSRTGYGFELASRVAMLGVLVLAARPLTRPRAAALALTLSAAILCRATIAATLLPALLLLLVHPGRHAGLRRPLLAVGLGLAVPVAVALGLSSLAALYEGTAPAAKLPLADLAGRTLIALPTLAAQLAWVADPNTVLVPLLRLTSPAPLLPTVFGAVVFLLALARWWRARATDGECLFIAAALGNALCGAWLYGDPQQFQLGMALEPLFLIAVAGQLQSLPRRHLAAGLLALLLLARAWQCQTLLAAERVVANPMLSGTAQRELTAAVLARADHGAVLTTTYNHVGLLETWSSGQIAPIHAYRALRRSKRGDADERLAAAWRTIIRAYPVRLVVFTVGDNPFEGPFTDSLTAQRALETTLQNSGMQVVRRDVFTCESGDPCYALWQLGPAAD